MAENQLKVGLGIGSGQDHGGHPAQDHDFVAVEINRVEHKIREGEHTVAELKTLGGVPQADDLEQIVKGQLILLPDAGHVKIEGHEKFVSHPKTGASS